MLGIVATIEPFETHQLADDEGWVLRSVSRFAKEVGRVRADDVAEPITPTNNIGRCCPDYFLADWLMGLNLTQQIPSARRFCDHAVDIEDARLEVSLCSDRLQSFVNGPHVRESDAGKFL